MKNSFTLFTIASVTLAILLNGCRPDPEDRETNNTPDTYEIIWNNLDMTKGLFSYYEGYGSGHNYDLTLLSGSFDLNEFGDFSGTGNLMFFQSFTNGHALEEGTYDFSENQDPMTFDDGYLYINYNEATQLADYTFEVTAGHYTITINNDTYTIDLHLDVDGYDVNDDFIGTQYIEGVYTGTLTNTDTDNSSYGTANVDGITAEFSKGYIEDYGFDEEANNHNFDITLVSESIDYINQTGTGDFLYFEMYTSTENFEGGTFTYSQEMQANTFDEGTLGINFNVTEDAGEHYYEVTSGSATVTPDGDKYNISFTMMAQKYNYANYEPVGDPVEITGSYNGHLEALEGKSLNRKKFIKK